MVATILYWGIVAAFCGWGLWNLVFSGIYLHNHENGNLWFFAILNALGALLGAIFLWVMSNVSWQKYWFDSSVKIGPWLGYILIFYVVLIVLQVILGREKKAPAAA
ncbi:hypothetical protein [Lacticaseibacillus suibinensis]|uniref:hypothetical protein n=1 Tax=Lacticaseibacillus suibinensis TaxID=2486011 RepID=UPI000F7B3145|nr:hypothetical protein [Lacticaseibacillus suibinensis]